MFELETIFTLNFWQQFFQAMIELPYFQPAIFLLGGIILVWLLFLKKSHSIALFKSSSGQVNLSRSALSALIRNTCTQLGINSRPRVKIKKRGKKIHLNIKLKLRYDQNVAQISEELQDSIGHSLKEYLCIENLGDINIFVSGFKAARRKNSFSSPPFSKAAKKGSSNGSSINEDDSSIGLDAGSSESSESK